MVASMEATRWKSGAITAVAPVVWGSTYFVTRYLLPSDRPFLGAAIRALPAGLILLAVRPRLLRGSWWWKSALISLLTIAGFFVLIYIAGVRLPSGLASTLMAASPAATIAFAWPLLGERPGVGSLLGTGLGIGGVVLLVGASAGGVDWIGVGAAVLAMVASSLGYVLTKLWDPKVDVIAFTGWQLLMAGVVLTPLALIVEGVPASVSARELGGYVYIALMASALAYVCWYFGLSRLPATTVGIIGLLNPLTGVLLGVGVGGESLTWLQWLGAALIPIGIWWGTRLTASDARPADR